MQVIAQHTFPAAEEQDAVPLVLLLSPAVCINPVATHLSLPSCSDAVISRSISPSTRCLSLAITDVHAPEKCKAIAKRSIAKRRHMRKNVPHLMSSI